MSEKEKGIDSCKSADVQFMTFRANHLVHKYVQQKSYNSMGCVTKTPKGKRDHAMDNTLDNPMLHASIIIGIRVARVFYEF